MTIWKTESRLCSLLFGIAIIGMSALTVLVLLVTAEAVPLTSGRDAASFENHSRGAVQLPGGTDPMDVVRTVQRNREATAANSSVSFAADNALPLLPSEADEVGPAFQIGGDSVYLPSLADQDGPAIAFDGTNYLVVWRDNRSSPYLEIYGARVSAGGVVLDPGGIAISTAPFGQYKDHPAVAFDGTNYLVVWNEVRSGSDTDVYGARVTTSGSVRDTAGIAISTAANEQSYPAVTFGGTDYLVVWMDLRSGEGSPSADIYGARVDTSGVVLDTTGIAISTAANEQCDPAVAFDGANFLVVWDDRGRGDDIYGARVSQLGNVLDPAGIAIGVAYSSQWGPVLAFDGTSYLVVWQDYRSGAWDIYGSRVSTSGSVLDPAGIAISTASYHQDSPAVAFDGTNYLVVWHYSGDIRGARVSTSGVVLDPAELVLLAGLTEYDSPTVAFDGTNYLTVCRGSRTYSSDICGARVGTSGVVLDPAYLVLSTSANEQRSPAVAFDGTNYLVAWADWRSESGWDIYATRVSADGNVLDPAGILVAAGGVTPAVAFGGTNYLVVWQWYGDIRCARVTTGGSVLDPAFIPIAAGAAYDRLPAVAFDGTNYLVMWRGDYAVQGTRVSTGGTVLDPGRIVVAFGENPKYPPAIAFDGTNYLIVWDAAGDIYGRRVGTDGSVIDPGAIAISMATNDQEHPAVAFDGTNHLVVWQDSRSETFDIYGARMDTSGTVIDPEGRAISTAGSKEESPAIAFDGTNYLVVWEDSSGAFDRNIYASRVSPSGSVLDSGGVVISDAENQQRYPAVCAGPPGMILIAYQSFICSPVYGSYRTWGNLWNSGSADVGSALRPSAYRAYQSYPNPFNPVCTIRYDIAHAGRASLKVFDVNGSVVRTLVDSWREPGVYREVWDGRRDDGTALTSGVYFYRLEAGKFVATKKMVLLK
jgi:hypothetical protein